MLAPPEPDAALNPVPEGWTQWTLKKAHVPRTRNSANDHNGMIFGTHFGVPVNVFYWETTSDDGLENRMVQYDGQDIGLFRVKGNTFYDATILYDLSALSESSRMSSSSFHSLIQAKWSAYFKTIIQGGRAPAACKKAQRFASAKQLTSAFHLFNNCQVRNSIPSVDDSKPQAVAFFEPVIGNFCHCLRPETIGLINEILTILLYSTPASQHRRIHARVRRMLHMWEIFMVRCLSGSGPLLVVANANASRIID